MKTCFVETRVILITIPETQNHACTSENVARRGRASGAGGKSASTAETARNAREMRGGKEGAGFAAWSMKPQPPEFLRETRPLKTVAYASSAGEGALDNLPLR